MSGAGKAGLVLTGGGARGAYQVGVLKALAEALPGPTPFRVMTGVSVGAINAVVLAEGADDFPAAVAKLERFWLDLECASVFVAKPWSLFGRLSRWGVSFGLRWAGMAPPVSLFNAAPLRAMIAAETDFGRIRAMIDAGALEALAVTASSYSTGESVTFVEAASDGAGWSRSRRLGVPADIDVDHVMASAALPAIFEARRIGRQWYGDGALRQTAPLSPAIRLGCDRLLTISARDGAIDAPPQPEADAGHPSLGLLGGQLFDIVFNDNLDADLERLGRVNDTLRRVPPERLEETGLRAVGARMVRPSADIRGLAGEHAHEMPWAVKTLLTAIGGMRAPWVLPSYLNFERGYVAALVDLGLRDGRRERDALLAFLSDPAPARAAG